MLTDFDKLKSRVDVLPYKTILDMSNITFQSVNVKGKANILADSMNQILLLVGIKQSVKRPDDNHNFGYC